jgi:hypothetical protein
MLRCHTEVAEVLPAPSLSITPAQRHTLSVTFENFPDIIKNYILHAFLEDSQFSKLDKEKRLRNL